jgi:hypothetical protein
MIKIFFRKQIFYLSKSVQNLPPIEGYQKSDKFLPIFENRRDFFLSPEIVWFLFATKNIFYISWNNIEIAILKLNLTHAFFDYSNALNMYPGTNPPAHYLGWNFQSMQRFALTPWSCVIVNACHLGDCSYGSWDRISPGYKRVSLKKFLRNYLICYQDTSLLLILYGSRVAIFFLVNPFTKMGKNYNRWPQNIPNGHKIYQMAVK